MSAPNYTPIYTQLEREVQKIILVKHQSHEQCVALVLKSNKDGNDYILMATTSFTSGTIRVRRFWMPDFNVMVDEGHPEQEPLSSRLTIPS